MPRPTPTRRSLLPVAVSLLCTVAAEPALAQRRPAPPSFGTATEIVNLSLSVTDGHNGYVTNLGESDFSVFEDGVRQDLRFFTRDSLPISLALMVDCSASMETKLRRAQDAAIRLARTLRPQDQAEIVAFNERSRTLQPFTNDLSALESAIRRTEAGGATALHNALYVTLRSLRHDEAGELRRSAIVLLSDGEDTASVVSDEQVLELAKKSEINIYTIELRAERSEQRAREAGGDGRAEYLMHALARETGGRAFFPDALGDLDSVYDQIAEELRTLYSVGYSSSNGRRDGKWRRIVVRVTGRDGVTVRHKLGYYAPAT